MEIRCQIRFVKLQTGKIHSQIANLALGKGFYLDILSDLAVRERTQSCFEFPFVRRP